ncbi:hypothetical protein [Streptomyces sp. NPDC004976]
MTRGGPGFISRWWLGARQRHGNNWAQRIIWVLERFDSDASGLDRWGSLCAMVPEDDPVARFDMARQLLPSVREIWRPRARRRVPTQNKTRRALRWTALTMAFLMMGLASAGYLYYEHLKSQVPSTATEAEKRKTIAEQVAKDNESFPADDLVSAVTQIWLGSVAVFGSVLLISVLSFIAWTWIDSGRAMKRVGETGRRDSP